MGRMRRARGVVGVSIGVLLSCAKDSRQEEASGGSESASGPTSDASGSATVASADGTGTAGSASATQGSATDSQDGSAEGPIFDVGGGGSTGGDCVGRNTDATLTGTVVGPDGEMPISGAVVYVSDDEPAGIPQQVYCDSCEPLGCDDEFTYTNPDGTFTLEATSGINKWLVVRKGQFMRISQIDIPPGQGQLTPQFTALPDHNDPASGLYIPLIAVGDGGYDRLEDALGKFGLGDTMIGAFEERLVPGTENFDLWDNGEDPTFDGFASQGTFAELVADPAALANYHIIFVPCSYDDYTFALSDAQNVDNVREWVANGGRWYVSDWSNEWLQMIFPEYQTLAAWNGTVGSADNGVYDSLADVLDADLLAWLEALPAQYEDINPLNDEMHPTLATLPQVQTVDNWSGIVATLPVWVDDGMGGQVDVGHKVWLEGPGGDPAPVHPLTVTGQFGCGKIQFTSYHTAEFFNYVGLSPQELVLIYTILEIGVCQDPLPPPEG